MSTLSEQVIEALKTDFDEVYESGFEKGKSQGGENPLMFANSISFNQVTFPDNYDLVCNIPNFTRFVEGAFYQTKGLKSIKLICDNKDVVWGTSNMFYGLNESYLETIDFTDFSTKINTFINFALNQTKLKYVLGSLDCSNVTASNGFLNIFTNCHLLEEVRFVKETVSKNISFAQSYKLSDESIQSIIDGLSTVETTQTITFYPSVKEKLTDGQKETISAKNWTLG